MRSRLHLTRYGFTYLAIYYRTSHMHYGFRSSRDSRSFAAPSLSISQSATSACSVSRTAGRATGPQPDFGAAFSCCLRPAAFATYAAARLIAAGERARLGAGERARLGAGGRTRLGMRAACHLSAPATARRPPPLRVGTFRAPAPAVGLRCCRPSSWPLTAGTAVAVVSPSCWTQSPFISNSIGSRHGTGSFVLQ